MPRRAPPWRRPRRSMGGAIHSRRRRGAPHTHKVARRLSLILLGTVSFIYARRRAAGGVRGTRLASPPARAPPRGRLPRHQQQTGLSAAPPPGAARALKQQGRNDMVPTAASRYEDAPVASLSPSPKEDQRGARAHELAGGGGAALGGGPGATRRRAAAADEDVAAALVGRAQSTIRPSALGREEATQTDGVAAPFGWAVQQQRSPSRGTRCRAVVQNRDLRPPGVGVFVPHSSGRRRQRLVVDACARRSCTGRASTSLLHGGPR